MYYENLVNTLSNKVMLVFYLTKGIYVYGMISMTQTFPERKNPERKNPERKNPEHNITETT
jgi:hypothetical protein